VLQTFRDGEAPEAAAEDDDFVPVHCALPFRAHCVRFTA
jgi:hypothetical protein